jgi:hypothetical protein
VTGEPTAAFSSQLANQASVFSRRQALSGGYAASAIDAKVRHGLWRALYPGVYTDTDNQPGRLGALWAVVLYAGRGAVLSYQTAAWLHGFGVEPADLIHVTIPVVRRVREPRGVRVHRAARVITAAVPERQPPRTRVEETVLDLVNESDSATAADLWVVRAIDAGATDHGKLLAAAGKRKKLRWRAEIGA